MSTPSQSARRPIVGHLLDAANLVTLAGLLSSSGAMTFALQGNFAAAAIGLVLAFFFDGIDGPVSKRLLGRSASDRAFGANLDSLVAMSGSGATPAVRLLDLGGAGAAACPAGLRPVAGGGARAAHPRDC